MYTEQCDGCVRVSRLEEQIKHINTIQDKFDRMFETLISLTCKFDENEKRTEKNSQILWGVLTAVVAQAVAFLFTLLNK